MAENDTLSLRWCLHSFRVSYKRNLGDFWGSQLFVQLKLLKIGDGRSKMREIFHIRNREVEETLSKTADFGCNEKYDKLELRNRCQHLDQDIVSHFIGNFVSERWPRRSLWRTTSDRTRRRSRRRTGRTGPTAPRSLIPSSCATGDRRLHEWIHEWVHEYQRLFFVWFCTSILFFKCSLTSKCVSKQITCLLSMNIFCKKEP